MANKLLSGLILAGMTAYSCAALAAAPRADLMSIYDLAVKNDAQLAAARAQLKSSEEVVPQSRAGLLPTLSLSATTVDNKNVNLYSGSLPNNGNHTDDFNSHGWQATLTQPLFKMDSWFTYDKAETLSEQAKATFAKDQQDLMLRVATAYFNVLQAQDNLETLEAEERAVKRQLDQTQQRYEVGLIAQTDVYEARAAYDNARVNRIVGENNVQVAYQGLWTLTNEQIKALGGLNKEMPVKAPYPNQQEAWVNDAMQHNLTVQVAELGADAAQKEVKVQKSGHAPELDAVASYGHNVNYGDASQPFNTKGNQTTIGLQLTVPIYSGGLTSSKVRQAEYDLEKTQQDLDFARRNTAQDTRSLFMTVNSDVQRIDARRLGIISAQSALEATQSGYEVGTRNVIDVLNAQQNLYASMRDYLDSRYDFLINTLKLKQAAGTLSPADLESLNKWISDKDSPLLPKL